MSALVELAATIPAAEIRCACRLILASPLFCRAPRMGRLLDYLVEKAISGDVRNTSEYAIGIEVFERDPGSYDTGDDPIVRVQAGRLRTRLKAYYAAGGGDTDIEITIPIGCYMPVIRRRGMSHAGCRQEPVLTIRPMRCVSRHGNGEIFARGLHDELTYHMHKAFGRIAVIDLPAAQEGGADTSPCINADHLFDGCIQIDHDRIRLFVRLTDRSTRRIAWSEQFDRTAPLSIALQEEIALDVCGALKRFLQG